MKKLLLILIASIATAYPLFAQLGAKTQQNIYGVWQNNEFGYQMTLMLQADGSGEFDGETIKQRIQGNQFLITQGGTTTAYQFVLNGNILTVSGGDLDAPIRFTRNGSVTAQSSQAVTDNSNRSAGIVGVWKNYGESIEFKSNGQCLYAGQTLNYQVSANQITLQSPQGSVAIQYTLQHDQLNLTVNGQQFSYTRATGNTSMGNSSVNGAGANQSGGRQLDMTLVGKWCYVNVTSTNSGGTSSDECITIHENGTYEYYAERSMSTNTTSYWAGTSSQNGDSGTWWVQGNQIFYQSQTRGQGSYQLVKQNHPKTGDPMIVLDGTAYVTQYQKAPW